VAQVREEATGCSPSVTGASTIRLQLVKLDARVDERPGAD
jgi:hypothetical protein